MKLSRRAASGVYNFTVHPYEAPWRSKPAMWSRNHPARIPTWLGAAVMLLGVGGSGPMAAGGDTKAAHDLDWQLPDPKLRLPFAQEQPIVFVSPQQTAEWQKLKGFWNPTTEEATDPATGLKVTRRIVKLKMPLGLSTPPRVPAENPLTVARWELGRDLYFDPVLSSNGKIACASCHDPRRGFTDQSPVSVGINDQVGGISAPTVMNSAFNPLQFWDGRAATLELQAQGPVQNPIEMFDGKGDAWHLAVQRVRAKGDYAQRFRAAFGTEPTRDAIAMAIAGYERTVLNGNSIHDRAEAAMRRRVAEEESVGFKFKPIDYETVLKAAVADGDTRALKALKLDPSADAATLKQVAEQINLGRELFFGKARCSLCHVGENFTDGLFHNLGVGVKNGKLPDDGLGRFAALPTGHKSVEAVGAFRTPTLRGLVSTAPYMHDGSEKTLEEVVEFYDRGGNAHEFLSPKMRDLEAEQRYRLSKAGGQPYQGPEVKLFGKSQTPIVPFRLGLSAAEKAALVLFLRALEGEVEPLVGDPKLRPPMP
ncbi:MAG: cytochrome C peroxidase [Gemmataceae bacterium]|nr:cytochrome C peroxidase [Gemmataceae bacterium]